GTVRARLTNRYDVAFMGRSLKGGRASGWTWQFLLLSERQRERLDFGLMSRGRNLLTPSACRVEKAFAPQSGCRHAITPAWRVICPRSLATVAATVDTVRRAAGAKRHFTVKDNLVTERSGYEEGFGPMLSN